MIRPEPWILSADEIKEFLGLVWQAFNPTLSKESRDRSELEQAALDAVRLYTLGATKAELADRLLYTFAGVESILLRDSREPLAQSIGDRLAFAVEHSADKRQEVVRLVRTAYDARSRFVHHGERIEELQAVEEFLGTVWKFFVVHLPRAVLRLQTKAALLDEIERDKYS